MPFSELIGHHSIASNLRQGIQQNRIPHAQLFLGPQGSGTLPMAISYAQYLLCTNRTNGDSCGVCNACRKSYKLAHPDLHFSYPTVGTGAISTHFVNEWRTAISGNPYLHINQWLQSINAGNKQGNITKNECLDIVKKISLKTYEASHKVLIMWLPEYLGGEGNRLLKLIEEPPANTVFILVAEQQDRILGTILSRCQLVKFPGLSDEDLAAALVAEYQLPQAKALEIAYLSEGNYNEAQNLVKAHDDELSGLFLEWLRICYKSVPGEIVPWVEQFARQGRENQKQFVRYGLHFLREFLMLRLGNDVPPRLRENEHQAAKRMQRVMDFDQVQQIVAVLDDAFFGIERNANPKILFLNASIQIGQAFKQVKQLA